MKVLVTGAAGFLGRHFVKDMLDRGWDVWGVDNLSGAYSQWPKDADVTRFITADVRSYLGFTNVETFDIIYHFAAPVGGREKIEGDPLYNAGSLSIDAHVFGTVAASHKKPLIVYPSSSAVYPVVDQALPGNKRLKESMFDPSQLGWGTPDEMYGFTKLAGEVLAFHAAKYGVKTLAIRPFSGYGEDQPLEYPMSSIVLRAVKREDPLIVWGPGTQTRDFIHVDDIVRLTQMRVLNEREKTDPWDDPDELEIKSYEAMNLCTGTATSFLDVAKRAAKIVGYNPDIAALIDKPTGVMHRVGDTTKMHMLVRAQPVITLDQGIERMVRYFESESGTV